MFQNIKKYLKLEMEVSNSIFGNLSMHIEGSFVKFTYMIKKLFSYLCLLTLFHVNKYLKYLSLNFKPYKSIILVKIGL
jgi:hypothetical protein